MIAGMNLRNLIALFLFPVILLVVLAAQAEPATVEPADAIVGLWNTEDDKSVVQIEKVEEAYSGSILKINKPTYPDDDPKGRAGKVRVDEENPDKALRSRPLAGVELLRGFTFNGDDEWTGGTIYDPESGKTYKCKLKLTDENTLKVRGYVGVSLLGRTTRWNRNITEEEERKEAAAAAAAKPKKP